LSHPGRTPTGISTRSEATAMPQNPIQFQPGMSLDDFFARYGTEAQRAAALETARWPQGFVCPHCGATAHSRFHADGREYWQCAQCRVQTSPTCGTLFESSKLPVTKWFQAMYLVTQNKNDLSALSLKRHLGVCYRTAWRLKDKLLEAMAERESGRLLTGVVVAANAVLRGKRRGGGKRGRGAEGKAAFIAAVELDEDGHPRHVRFDPLPDLKGDTLRAWVRKAGSRRAPRHRRLGEPRLRRCARRRPRGDRGQPAPIQRDRCVPPGQYRHLQPQDRDPGHIPPHQCPQVLGALPRRGAVSP
jgi:ribosomal protein L37AE/L43A